MNDFEKWMVRNKICWNHLNTAEKQNAVSEFKNGKQQPISNRTPSAPVNNGAEGAGTDSRNNSKIRTKRID